MKIKKNPDAKVYAWKDALRALGPTPEFNLIIALYFVFQLPPNIYPSGKVIQLPLPPHAGKAYKLYNGNQFPRPESLTINPETVLANFTHPTKPIFEELRIKFPGYNWAADPSELNHVVLSHMFAPPYHHGHHFSFRS